MTNFDYLKKEKQFDSFSEVAICSEKLLPIDREACVINCRRAMEFAVKWLYSVDASLQKPYQDNLHSLMSTEEFRLLVDKGVWRRMDLIRKMGNRAAHAGAKITFDEASLCLQNLFIFLDFVACCYAKEYEERQFDLSLLGKGLPEQQVPHRTFADVDLQALIEENKALKAELTKRRESKHPAYVPKPLDLSEYKTRKIYIDFMLRDAGWVEGQNWLNEVKIEGMPNQSGKGYADYVLYDDAHKPLAVIEAKSACEDVARGRQQAKLYADILEQKYQRRPVIFLTNGFDTRIIDGQYPERQVSGVYSKRDLEKWFNLRSGRTPLKNIVVDQKIAGRYYQEAAIRAVCDSFGEGNRRKALLVMATGAGKTRTVIALCKALMHAGWIRNVLFLADRNSLVTQAKRSFVNQFTEELSVVNVVEEKNNYNARCVFSTYQTMIHLIDDAVDQEGKIFSCGHFDLIICDEAHRSIYNKYKDIFTYFDALLVGLTATPKEDIDKNTYSIFDLEDGVPTYGYDLAQAVTDGFLVDYLSVESEVKFIEQGIAYDELSQEDREAYENTFKDENGNFPERIQSSAINKWLFNEDTIKQVLRVLMNEGLKIDYGQKLGKTIIFAVNHNHAEKIYEIFNKEYPHLSRNGQDFARVIDNRTEYAQKAIDEFAEAGKLPQIAISVDMLDTGIDVPEVLNLVFFKKVLSRAKFWQMIGRGTRLCPGLVDGEDKQKFYIFDFCGNFAFFRVNEGKPTVNQMALQSAIFNLEFQIAYKLQDASRQVNRLIAYREKLVETMSGKVQELNRETEIQVKTDLIQKILQTGYVDDAGIDELEYIREELRSLMKYIPQKVAKYETNFADDILSTEWYEAELESGDLKNYKEKAEYYIRQNRNHIAIVKLRGNKPLSDFDVQSLEEILWGELGTREDYEREYGEKPLGEFVREIVGLDMNAAKEAFAEYLNGSRMDSRQIYFVNQIIEYIVHNGLLKDFSVLQQSPFTDKGSVVEIFTDMDVWTGIRKVIEQINANAMA